MTTPNWFNNPYSSLTTGEQREVQEYKEYRDNAVQSGTEAYTESLDKLHAELEKVGEYTYVMDKIRTLTVENKLLKEHIIELEGVLRDITNDAKEVLTNARNTPAVRRQLEMSGSIKHYIVPRHSIINAENYLKEKGE